MCTANAMIVTPFSIQCFGAHEKENRTKTQSNKNTACEDTCESEVNGLKYDISVFVLVTNLRLAYIQEEVALHPE